MSTSKEPSSPSSSGAAVVKLATVVAMVWLMARALLACDATSDGACLRFSDCASGLTCANGECVTPPSGDMDGSAGAATSGSSSGSATGASGDQSTSGDTSGDTSGTDESDDSGTTSTE